VHLCIRILFDGFVEFSLWSKDIILLVADDYIEGTHAFLAGVHEVQQSSEMECYPDGTHSRATDLQYEPLKLNSGPIWVALHLDYPHHSFDRIGLFFEGVNGLLPNLDLVTSVIHIIKWVGATPSVLHGAVDVDWPKLGMLEKYKTAFGNVFQQVSYGALGQPSGPEGVYSRCAFCLPPTQLLTYGQGTASTPSPFMLSPPKGPTASTTSAV
jgi:glycosylphosphatidylinositol transamidase